jgi:hypothetical protein
VGSLLYPGFLHSYRFCDTWTSPPDTTSPMHRTVSLNYGVVLEGEIEFVLDSSERRTMRKRRSVNSACDGPGAAEP